MSEEQLQSEIATLEGQLVGDMFQDMELKEKIYKLKQELKTKSSNTGPLPQRPDDSQFECIGCGS